MLHSDLSRKFRESFEDEKFLFIVQKELSRLSDDVLQYANHGTPRIHNLIPNFIKSEDSLYHYYTSKNLMNDYQNLRKRIDFYVSQEEMPFLYPGRADDLRSDINRFLQKLAK